MSSRSSPGSFEVAWRSTASARSARVMPAPSSVTRISRRPPPSVTTSMRVAPASSAFSTSSLTTLAGRSTTSPAAMRLTMPSESWRTGMSWPCGESSGRGSAVYARTCRVGKGALLGLDGGQNRRRDIRAFTPVFAGYAHHRRYDRRFCPPYDSVIPPPPWRARSRRAARRRCARPAPGSARRRRAAPRRPSFRLRPGTPGP